MYKRKTAATRKCRAVVCRGAGGNRTLVQTGKPYAFYTLIPAFDFRAQARPGPPTCALSFKFSPPVQGRGRLSPILLHHFAGMLRSHSFRVMSRFSTWCRNKGNLLYFDYAARAYLFSPDKFLTAEIIEETVHPLRAYVPFHPAVKSMSTPDVWNCKDKIFFWNALHCPAFFCKKEIKKAGICLLCLGKKKNSCYFAIK